MRRRCCCRSLCSKTIRREELARVMSKEKIILIDVRSTQEYNEGHYDGAINIPLCDIRNDISRHVNDKNCTIVVYCSVGHRSRKAQEILNALGYNNVYNLV